MVTNGALTNFDPGVMRRGVSEYTLVQSQGNQWAQSEQDLPVAMGGSMTQAFVFQDAAWIYNYGNNKFYRTADGETWAEADPSPWTKNLPNSFPDFKFAVLGSKVYAVGARWDAGTARGEVWSSSDGLSWSMIKQHVAETSWGARRAFGLCVFEGKLYLAGGRLYDADGELLEESAEVWSSSDGITWIRETAAGEFGEVTEPEMVATANRLLLIGGARAPTDEETKVYGTTDGANWTWLSSFSVVERDFFRVLWDGSLIHVFGGSSETTYTLVADRWWTSPDGVNWTSRTPGWGAREDAMGFVLSNRLFVVGGDDNYTTESALDEIWIYGSSASSEATAPFQFDRCADPAGAAYGLGPVGDDFEVGVLLDLDRGAMFLGSECRFTAPMIDPAAGCAADGQMLGPLFFGDRDGFMNLALDDRLLTWGSPYNRFIHAVDSAAPGDASTVKLAAAVSGFVDADGNGLLQGLIVAKVTPSTHGVEYRRIASNTNQILTIETVSDVGWETNPAVGDIVIVAPLPILVQWGEMRRRAPALARRVALNLQVDPNPDADGSDLLADFSGLLQWDVFSASGGNNLADLDTPAVTQRLGVEDLEKGKGIVYLAPSASKSTAHRLILLGPQTGPVKVRDIAVAERQKRGEGGR